MRSLPRIALVAAATALTSGVGILFGFAGAPSVESVVEFCALTLIATLVSAFGIPQSGPNAGATMPPSFVFTFAALLRFGGGAATVVAAASAATSAFVQWRL